MKSPPSGIDTQGINRSARPRRARRPPTDAQLLANARRAAQLHADPKISYRPPRSRLRRRAQHPGTCPACNTAYAAGTTLTLVKGPDERAYWVHWTKNLRCVRTIAQRLLNEADTQQRLAQRRRQRLNT